MRDTADAHLHPAFRAPLQLLEGDIQGAGIPLRRYEGARSPFRQAELYTAGGRTRALPWGSYHQYCLAADLVFYVSGQPTWTEPAPGLWAEFHMLAQRRGLRVLNWEQPHVELPVSLKDVEAGRFPDDGGDSTWRDWLETQIELWGTQARTVNGVVMPGAPRALLTVHDRPVLAA